MKTNNFESMVNMTVDILFKLICSGVYNLSMIGKDEEPQVGDWCYEMTSPKSEIKCLGMLLQKTSDSYTIQTLLGQRVCWTNARFTKVPSELVDKESIKQLWEFLKNEEKADVIIPDFLYEGLDKETAEPEL